MVALEWAGTGDIKRNGALTKVAGAALLAMRSVVKSSERLSACTTPGVLIRSGQVADDSFLSEIITAVHNVLAKNPRLDRLIQESDGVLKTPVVITSLTSENQNTLSGAHVKIAKGVYFDPQIVTSHGTASSMRTVYVDTAKIKTSALEKGLKRGLKRSLNHANDALPRLPERSRVHNWSDLCRVYEQKDEAGLMQKFHVDHLPDLQTISKWTDLPDKYLTSKELIQKYLRPGIVR